VGDSYKEVEMNPDNEQDRSKSIDDRLTVIVYILSGIAGGLFAVWISSLLF